MPSTSRIPALASLALFACACASPPPPPADAIIELPDSGPTPAEDDAGPPDAGDGLCADLSDLPFGTPPLPPACLPRCTAATRDAIAACGDDTACAQGAIDADATSPISFRTRYGIYTVACRAMRTFPCVLWQTYSCYEEHCRPEFYEYSDCLDAGGTCETELAPLEACMDASPDAIACLATRTRECFP